MNNRPPNARRAAFTTIELMVAIAIIVILLGITVLGFRRVATGAQENQTKTQLERLRSMTTALTSNKAAGQKFFGQQIPYVYAQPIGTGDVATPGPWWEAVPAGADDSLYRTALVLRTLLQSAEARAIYDELPTERKKLMHFDTGNNGQIVAAAGTNILSIAIPLDAWNNPIRFVFDNWQLSTGGTSSQLRTLPTGGLTGGLTNLHSESAKGFWAPTVQPTTPLTGTAYSPPMGYTSLGTAVRSPDRQPFWASAGPDGRMETQDDNVYSFEN